MFDIANLSGYTPDELAEGYVLARRAVENLKRARMFSADLCENLAKMGDQIIRAGEDQIGVRFHQHILIADENLPE